MQQQQQQQEEGGQMLPQGCFLSQMQEDNVLGSYMFSSYYPDGSGLCAGGFDDLQCEHCCGGQR